MAAKERQALTIRFDDPALYDMLSWMASENQVSMNSLVQRAVQDLLSREAAALEKRLQSALGVVQRYQVEDASRYIAAFARAEVSEEDPNQATAYLPEEDALSADRPFLQPAE